MGVERLRVVCARAEALPHQPLGEVATGVGAPVTERAGACRPPVVLHGPVYGIPEGPELAIHSVELLIVDREPVEGGAVQE